MPTRAASKIKTTKTSPTSSKTRFVLALVFNIFAAASVFSQSSQKEASATVSGRVTKGDHGVAGVSVTLMPSDRQGPPKMMHAKTDGEGRYRVTNLPPGRYMVAPFAPAYVIEGMDNYPQGKTLTLSAGDVADNIDFRIERGGVVTGRITDADGNPVVAQQVLISMADNGPKTGRRAVIFGVAGDARSHMTDDRGIYRIYGLPAGRYHVSVGSDTGSGMISYGRRKLYQRIFYPDATDETQAQVVEVSAGGEAENIDIKLGSPVKTYKASGRFVDAATGRPVPNIAFGYGPIDPTQQRITNVGGNGAPTDANGEFVVEGLAPGHYAAFASPFTSPQEANDFYSDPVVFDVVDSDVNGVVVTLKHGTTLSGFVAVEGASDNASVTHLAGQIQVFAYYDVTAQQAMSQLTAYVRPTTVAPDGSFRLTGLRPGRLRVMVTGQVKMLTLSRVEMNGAVVTNGIEISEGTQVSGVRVVITYGSGGMHGQLSVSNGTLSPAANLTAFARRVSGGEDQGWHSSEVDARGRFEMQGLAPGEYDVHVQGFVPNTPQRYQSEHQYVTVSDGGVTNVTLALDLNAPQNRGGRP